MMLIISIGGWGGIYFYRGWSKRLCLGWVAITFIPSDDTILSDEQYRDLLGA
jgi:hypothetical protein